MGTNQNERKFPGHKGIKGMRLYKLMRGSIRTGDVLEWRSEGFLAVGHIVRAITKKDVNHTGGVYRFTDLTKELKERVYTLESLAKGFYPNYLSNSLRGFVGKVYLLPLKTPYDQERCEVAAEQWKMLGKPYDTEGLFKNMFSRVSEDARAFWCSEAIGRSFRNVGLIEKDYLGGKGLWPGEFEGTGIFEPRVRIF